MKWCCSRNTTGITIGSFYIVGSVLYFVFELLSYITYDKHVEDPERKQQLKSEAIQSMIICLLAVVISSLFIVAIVKRCEYLILPWLLFTIYVFYVTLNTMYWWFIGAGMGMASAVVFIVLILILISSVAIEIYIFYFSYSLFKEIRLENIEKSERVGQQML